MDPLSAAIVNVATGQSQVAVQQQVQVAMLRQALDLQASSAAQLLQTLPQPALATSGTVGTLVNVYA